jgi:type I restriction enzyme, S subunit
MKKGWEMKTLGDLYDITSSKRVFESDWRKSGVPFYRAREIVKLAKQGFVDNELFISEEMYKQYSEKYGIPKEGDIMVTGVGTLGICYVVQKNDKFYFKDGNIIWLKTKNGINSRFVEYAFQSDFLRKQIDDSVGATVGTFTIIKAKNTVIPIPPLPEQQRIVSVLDEAFASIAQAKSNAERNLVNARELFESYLKGVFETKSDDWEEKKLGDIGKVSMCKRVYKEQTTTTGDIPFYKIGTFGKEPDVFIPKTLYDEFRNKFSFPKKGDILISAAGTIGRRVKYDGEPAYFQDSNIVWIDNDEKQVLNDYLYQFYGACNWNSTTGATIPRLYNDNLRQIEIHFPKSLAEQRAIVGRLEALSAETGRLEEIYQQKVESLEELKKSVLGKAFGGEL